MYLQTHFSPNASSHPIITIIEEEPGEHAELDTPIPDFTPPDNQVKEFVHSNHPAHQVKSQPHQKEIRSELELCASEPGIIER